MCVYLYISQSEPRVRLYIGAVIHFDPVHLSNFTIKIQILETEAGNSTGISQHIIMMISL